MIFLFKVLVLIFKVNIYNYRMITKPTFLIDEIKCKSNINFMAEKAASHNLIFRPHFKTHQSLEIGSWFKEIGVSKITVSSIEMASYFSVEGMISQ